MPSSNPRVQPTGPFIPGVFLLAALATAVYQAIKIYPPLLLIFSFFILLTGANIQIILNRSEGIPSGTYITFLSIACVLVGLVCDKNTKSTWESCFFHIVLSHFVLMWFEQNRFSRLRRKVREEEKAQSKHDPEKEVSQTPEGDPHA
jgi:hypothetical protein